ncbi:MAG: DinB family protein [Verrucomicrobia bacterium]|nr:DinB family protein [Verrucomicrobiota bacterium]
MKLEALPKLAAPGAGLPKIELIFSRFRFGWALRTRSREQFSALFESERVQILALARSCDAETGARPVLIDRLRGMEDSSRYWSVFMTLDHLRIVNLAVAGAIRALGKGELPDRVARTADVKPDPAADITAIDDFERSCEFLSTCAQQVPDLKTSQRFDHPWFGPMDAGGWHALGAVHMSIHRKQIERILRV